MSGSTPATTVAVPTGPRRPVLNRTTAMRLAAEEYRRFTDELRGLTPAEWRLPTPNTGWTVHDMAAHVLGMAEMAASPIEQARQLRAARRAVGDGVWIDALTGVQVAKHRSRSPEEIVRRLDAVGSKAARRRRRTPGFVRRRTLPPPQVIGGVTETWTIGFLTDVVLTRDPWMHRSDLAVAVGRPMRLTADHDAVLVADVVAEWHERHGRAATLDLTGPAGGHWSWGEGGPAYELDAVEFCRILSGRGTGDGLLAVPVPF